MQTTARWPCTRTVARGHAREAQPKTTGGRTESARRGRAPDARGVERQHGESGGRYKVIRRGGQRHRRQRCGGKSRKCATRLASLAKLTGLGDGRSVAATIVGRSAGLRHGMVHAVLHGAGWLETVRGHVALEDNRPTQQKNKHQTHGRILNARHDCHAGGMLTRIGAPAAKPLPLWA